MKALSGFFFALMCQSVASVTRNLILSQNCRILRDKFDTSGLYQRNFLLGSRYRWPNNTVPYVISKRYSDKDVNLIIETMRLIKDNSCIKWIPRTSEKNYVYINTDDRGCYAQLGYNRYRGKHLLNLQETIGDGTCMILGTVAHEMLHALGFSHEQNRPDRDLFVEIFWTNIQDKNYYDFFRALGKHERRIKVCDPSSGATSFDDCDSGYRADTFGLPYEYGSIMHYDQYSFSKNGKVVFVPLKKVPPGVTMGHTERPTGLDYEKLSEAYNCQPLKKTTPENGCEDHNDEICKIFAKYCPYQAFKSVCKKTCNNC